jgi:GH15 family glucan-1,4-alpha-glucosidase
LAYQPIENYGIIGNMHTAALVSMDGSIDWFCFPRFDSPSVFAAILDDQKGGRFRIAPKAEHITSRQMYWPDTNVLVTYFLARGEAGEITDFMPMDVTGTGTRRDRLVRRVRALRGSMTFRIQCRPGFNYARAQHETEIIDQGACFHTPELSLGLITPLPLRKDDDAATGEFTLREGETASFLLERVAPHTGISTPLSEREAAELLDRTVLYWRQWISKCTYRGRWREVVHRSALLLELLCYEPTGAVVAAPTCSLPEDAGGQRNWDYRYSWIRDSAFTIYALLRVGLTDEAARFMNWIESLCRQIEPNGSLQTVYGIDGGKQLPECTLGHLQGYRGSRPVRVGNAAADQLQLDIYGELMDSVYLYNKYVTPISYEFWTALRRIVNWVAANWQREDNGIWEVRTGPRHFVYSKLMCWVALDRGVRLADKRSFPAERDHWVKCRDQIYEEVLTQGWSAERQSFLQHYGSETLDAATLMMPLTFFMSPTDPRMIGTIEAICEPLAQGGLFSNGTIHRYNLGETKDGLSGGEGGFNMCTFWLIEALTRAGHTDPARLDQARFLFERMLGQSNHLGLYSEESGARGEALGNFPQAFTHLGLISAAFNLDRALG